MMRPALRVAALIIAAHGACVGPRTASEMAALFAAPYESVDRPTVALNRTDADPDPETVSLQLQVLKIRSIHEKDQTLVVHAFFRRSWSDPRLAWAAGDETPCVDEFDFPISMQSKIWSPDVYVENTAERDVEFSAGAIYVRSDGSVRSSVQVLFSLTCAMSFEAMPYDTQTCSIDVGTFRENNAAVKLACGRPRGAFWGKRGYP